MRESINHLLDKIKSTIELTNNRDIFFVVLIILSNLASFGLGRLSKIDENRQPLKIINEQNQALIGDFQETNTQTKGKYVASKSGKKYHLPWCSGALTIKDSNKIWFDTKEEAEASGYSPASNCKGI